MGNKLTEAAWKNLLPDVYLWVDKVKLTWTNAVESAETYVVPVKVDDDQGNKKTVLTGDLPVATVKELVDAWDKSAWQGKSGSLMLNLGQSRFILAPLTTVKTTDVQIARQFGMDVARYLKDYQISSIVFCRSGQLKDLDFFDGLCLGLYDAGLFKGSKLTMSGANAGLLKFPEHVGFLGYKEDAVSAKNYRQLAKATALTRMLQDAPPNWLTPTRFGDIAADVAKELGLKCTLLGPADLDNLGAGSMMSVTHGSVEEPRLIAIEIPGKDTSRTIALIGKGLTFDAGGISLKPGLGMGEMKYDMSGGAAVLGSAYYLAQAKPATNVVCIIGAVENMPGPAATKPGDVVVAMNGKTIDVQNTDAEGRLVLADLLHYANTKYKPVMMFDIATLTGAVLHALGHVGAAVMSNDQQTADLVLQSARSVGEPAWQLPLWPEFERDVKGDCSDLVNIAKPNVQAGTVIGGIFLMEFVGSTKWAHIDIAGTGWQCKATGLPASGGSSFGVRTLSEICQRV